MEKTENEAAALLTEAGLLTGEISRAHDASVPAGQVISQGIERTRMRSWELPWIWW